MGHKTIQMTMRYAHLAPAHQLAAVERLASGFPQGAPTTSANPTDTRTDTSPQSEVLLKAITVN